MGRGCLGTEIYIVGRGRVPLAAGAPDTGVIIQEDPELVGELAPAEVGCFGVVNATVELEDTPTDVKSIRRS
jgi:hypothetical protein